MNCIGIKRFPRVNRPSFRKSHYIGVFSMQMETTPLQERATHSNRCPVDLDDRELVTRFREGNESAFNTIVARYQQRLVRFAQAILGNDEDARDISQEAFVKAYFNLKSFREDSSLYTWLYRIVYNLCISHLRRKKIVSFLSFDQHDEGMEFDSKEPGPSETFERKEILRAVTDALTTLPPNSGRCSPSISSKASHTGKSPGSWE